MQSSLYSTSSLQILSTGNMFMLQHLVHSVKASVIHFCAQIKDVSKLHQICIITLPAVPAL